MVKKRQIDYTTEGRLKCIRIDFGMCLFNEILGKVKKISKTLGTRVEYDFESCVNHNWGPVFVQFFWRSGLNPTLVNEILNRFPIENIEIKEYTYDSRLRYVDVREWKWTKFCSLLKSVKRSFLDSLVQS